MLFNSYEFIFVFFPIAAVGFFLFGHIGGRAPAILWLLAASLVFYGWWNPAYVWLIVASIIINFAIGRVIAHCSDRHRTLAKIVVGSGIAANLGLLGYYKYTGFILQNINAEFGAHIAIPEIILPLAISFFTFQQISFLVDIYRGENPRSLGNLIEYSTLVAFFPHLIAGPIVFYRELAPQFEDEATFRFRYENLAVGATIFFVGLFKKVILADNLAQSANVVFHGASHSVPAIADAWLGLSSYTLQIYFDFSGYSDMAIGAAWVLGITLPLNFDSPYKSRSIIEFWRRWHITLSRFLRDYLYIPLGGNRHGVPRQMINIAITMLLAGLWHGAGWTFLAWGGLHGLYLVINHTWRRQIVGRWPAIALVSGYRSFCALLTMAAVTFGWIFFRSVDFSSALNLVDGLVGTSGVGFPPAHSTKALLLVVTGGTIALLCPNIYQIMNVYRSMRPSHDQEREIGGSLIWSNRLKWSPSLSWAFALAAMAIVSIVYVSRSTEFIYFQF